MQEALKEAHKAFDEDEVPVGAVVVCNEQIIGRGYNQVEKLKDATAHAEMIAITSAFNYFDSKYLQNCWLYVTLEPCLMCAGAIHWSQLSGLYYGASDPKKGIFQYNTAVFDKSFLIQPGILENESKSLLDAFFFKMRQK